MEAKLKAIVKKLNEKYGEGTIVLGSEVSWDLPRCPTGSLSLDVALGGGWPMNQWSEIVGEESSGKTLIAMKTVAANQARNPSWMTVWFDAEHTYDPVWARKLGVDSEKVIVIPEQGMEQVYQMALEFLSSREVDCIIIDSLPALVPEREENAAMEDFQVGLGAFLTGKFFRKQGSHTKRSLAESERPVLGLMINQWREKIGVMYGDPRTTPGGKGKNFFYVTRVEVRRDEWIEEKDTRYGQTIKARVFKNKTAVPHRLALMDFYFSDLAPFKAGQFDEVKEIANLAVLKKIITQHGGGFYRYGEDHKWRGRQGLYDAIRTDDAVRAAITAEVLGAAVVEPQEAPRKVARRPRAAK
jgi:recombination protein RecA